MSEDRRRTPREDREDPATTSEDRATWLDRHWHKVIWAIGAFVASCGIATKTLGLHVAGPSDAIAAQARADTALVGRVIQLERRADRFDVALTLQSYMLCVNNRSNDVVVQERCRPIIASMQTRGTP